MNKENKELENVVEESAAPKMKSDERYTKLGFFGTLKRGFVNLFLDMRASFIYNKMKLSALLIGVPGVLLGFFITFHYNVISKLTFLPSPDTPHTGLTIYNTTTSGNDYSAICFFVLMLLGILNLFTAVACSGKKNLGSVVTATVSTGFMLILTIVYYMYILTSISYINQGVVRSNNPISMGSLDFIMVTISCVGSVVCSAIGCVFGFINYDRTYKKSDSK